jgi:hypothetical protein
MLFHARTHLERRDSDRFHLIPPFLLRRSSTPTYTNEVFVDRRRRRKQADPSNAELKVGQRAVLLSITVSLLLGGLGDIPHDMVPACNRIDRFASERGDIRNGR